MSNTIAHLAVARELLKKCPNLIHNERAYYLGTLAPDTIGGKPDYKREDKKKVHLLTDKCNHETIRQKLLKKAIERGDVSSVREFYHASGSGRGNDVEALDSYLLESYPELGDLFSELISKEVDYCLPGWIEKQYIKNSIWWWNNHYLPGIKEQELLYLATEDMEEFITYSVSKIAEELKEVVYVENRK
jgi:hypothetical protein